MSRRDWTAILDRSAAIVRSYDTGVTLRQLFYRLVADGTLPNNRSAYTSLSSYTAEARRSDGFPPLIDRTRRIHRDLTFDDLEDARDWLESVYRLDRTIGQPYSIYLGVEKDGIVEQLSAWFGHLGVGILALGGYSSQTYVDEVARDVRYHRRPAVLLYAGDFDPSGMDIDRDFTERTGCFTEVIRVALDAEQVEAYNLPPQMGKKKDTRAAAFVAKHGALVQVELDALPPDQLRALYQDALTPYWDPDAYSRVCFLEDAERAELEASR